MVIYLRDITAAPTGIWEMTNILPPGTQVKGVGIFLKGTAWIYGGHDVFSINLLGRIRFVF